MAGNEAFAKIKLYDIDFSKFNHGTGWQNTTYHQRYDFHRYNSSNVLISSIDNKDLDKFNISYVDPLKNISSLEKFYPSDENINKNDIKYSWAAIGRLVDPNDYRVEVTVFVSHKIAQSTRYHEANSSDSTLVSGGMVLWPEPIKVKVEVAMFGGKRKDNILKFGHSSEVDLIVVGSTIVDDRTSRLYRVVDRFEDGGNWYIVLDRNWEYNWCDKDGNWEDSGGNPFTFDPEFVWVIPPGIGASKSPCVGVYQRIINLPQD